MKIFYFINVIAVLSFFISVAPSEIYAKSFCEEVASEKNGNTLYVCGVGESTQEIEAKMLAKTEAFRELDSLCINSVDCNNYEVDIVPMRDFCKKERNIFKCYRGLEAKVSNKKRSTTIERHFSDQYESTKFISNKIVKTNTQLKISKIVTFQSNPTDSNVYIDGVKSCNTPCARELTEGAHSIKFEKDLYVSVTDHIEVSKIPLVLKVKLEDTYGKLNIIGSPSDGKIIIDNVLHKSFPVRLKPKIYTISVLSDRYQPFQKKIEIVQGEQNNLVFDSERLYGNISLSARDKNNNALSADIYIDGKLLEEKTPVILKLATGRVRIELLYKNYYASKDMIIEFDRENHLNQVVDFKNWNLDLSNRFCLAKNKTACKINELLLYENECNKNNFDYCGRAGQLHLFINDDQDMAIKYFHKGCNGLNVSACAFFEDFGLNYGTNPKQNLTQLLYSKCNLNQTKVEIEIEACSQLFSVYYRNFNVKEAMKFSKYLCETRKQYFDCFLHGLVFNTLGNSAEAIRYLHTACHNGINNACIAKSIIQGNFSSENFSKFCNLNQPPQADVEKEEEGQDCYNMACVFSPLKAIDKSLQAIDQLINKNKSSQKGHLKWLIKLIEREPDLKNLADSDKYKHYINELMEKSSL